MQTIQSQLADATFELDMKTKKLEEKALVNQNLESVAKFLREENEQLTNEAAEVSKQNKRLQAAMDMRKSSLLALTKSNKNLGMKILTLERQISSDSSCKKWENQFILSSWEKEHFGTI
jgi:chromosome segregation ATPase